MKNIEEFWFWLRVFGVAIILGCITYLAGDLFIKQATFVTAGDLFGARVMAPLAFAALGGYLTILFIKKP